MTRHLFILPLLLLTFYSCAPKKEEPKKEPDLSAMFDRVLGNTKFLDAPALKALLDEENEPQLLDVRSKAAYEEGHLAGSINLNAKDDEFSQAIRELDRDRTVYVYGGAAGGSAEASARLAAIGCQVVVLSSDIEGWERAGFEIVKD